MKTSDNGVKLIKQFEGCRLKAYKDAVGVWTIGYGHTGADVKAGQVITQAQADVLLKNDLVKFELKVDKYNPQYSYNQNEFDALVSFAFNVGSIDQLTAKGTRNKSEVAAKMLQYNKAGGKVLAGLTKRRKAERELFLKPCAVAPVQPIQAAAVQAEYYPKYTGSGTLLQALKSSGCTDTSLTFRRKIAAKNGITKYESSYTGTTFQNTQMYDLLKKGKLLKP